MNKFLVRYNELIVEFERKMTQQTNLAEQQNMLIERLTKENQTYKERLEALTSQSETQIRNFLIQQKQLQDTIAKLNSENKIQNELIRRLEKQIRL